MEPPNAIGLNQKLTSIVYIDYNCEKYPLNLNAEGDVISFSLEFN